jgi:hypothetical protein
VQGHSVPQPQDSAGRDSGNYGSGALDWEHVFDPQPEQAIGWAIFATGNDLVQRVKKLTKPRPVDIGYRANRRLREKRPGQQHFEFPGNLRKPRWVDEVGLRQRHHSMLEPHERENMEVLVRLGHDAVISRYDEDDDVYAMSPGGHVPDEINVPGDVDDTHNTIICKPARRETEINRETALLLFGQSVGFAAGEKFHERSFAVVNVPGGTEHDMSSRYAHTLVGLPCGGAVSRCTPGGCAGARRAQELPVRPASLCVGGIKVN